MLFGVGATAPPRRLNHRKKQPGDAKRPGIRRQIMDEQQGNNPGNEAPAGSGKTVYDNLRIHMVHGDTSKTAAFVSCKILTEAGALFLNSMALVRGANG